MNEVSDKMGTTVTVKNNFSSFTGADSQNVDDEVSASFLHLLPEIKRMILKKLNLSSRYNLCVVWKDMENEFWKPIDIKKRWLFIRTLEDFELAGVLASAGYVDTVKSLLLVRVDVFDIPSNIINNLVKIVKESITLRNVTGWRTSMLSDVKCKYLTISDLELASGSDIRPIVVSHRLKLDNVRGDLEGLFRSTTSDQEVTFELNLRNCDLEVVSCYSLNRLFKKANRITLRALTGFFAQQLSEVSCNRIDFEEIEIQDPLDSKSSQTIMIRDLTFYNVRGNVNSLFDNIKHCHKLTLRNVDDSILSHLNLTSIVKDKVYTLSSLFPFPLTKLLNEYDGQGKCDRIEIHGMWSFSDSKSWANARGWKVRKDILNGRKKNTFKTGQVISFTNSKK